MWLPLSYSCQLRHNREGGCYPHDATSRREFVAGQGSWAIVYALEEADGLLTHIQSTALV